MPQHALTRSLRLHSTLVAGLVAAILAAALTPPQWHWPVRAATGWDVGVAVFLLLTLARVVRTRSIEAIRRRAADLDQTGAVVLPLSLLAAAVSVAVVVSEAAAATDGQGMVGVEALRVLATLGLSWLSVHVIFALHYAHRYYGQTHQGDNGGLMFPGGEDPDYWDFLHFALIIGVAAQTADIQITDRRIRRLATLHSVCAFIFNTVLVALAVNLAVSLI